MRVILVIAGLLGSIGVVMGAMGAHMVSEPTAKEWIRLGSTYQLIHCLAIFASLAILKKFHPSQLLFLAGILLFSGSLFGLALTGEQIFRSITPYGGMSFIVAWFWSGLVLKF